jgi:ABC-type glycerol-3-phosphate transport system permease component
MHVKPFTVMDILRQTIVIALLLVTLFPIYWMITTSLKPTSDILVSPPRFFFQPTLEHVDRSPSVHRDCG